MDAPVEAWIDEAYRRIAAARGVVGPKAPVVRAVAEALNVEAGLPPYSANTLGNWRRGENEVPFRVALGLARLSGLSLNHLAGLHGEATVMSFEPPAGLDLGAVRAQLGRILAMIESEDATARVVGAGPRARQARGA